MGLPANALWFYWGEAHLAFPLYMTIRSAMAYHPDVRVVLKRTPDTKFPEWFGESMRRVRMIPMPSCRNWMADLLALVPADRIHYVEDLAPEVAALNAPGVHAGDLMKYWTLANIGGSVADIDVTFIRAVPEIERDVQVVNWPLDLGLGSVPMAFMQGRPCAAWESAYRAALRTFDPDRYFSTGSTAIGFCPEGTLDRYAVNPWVGTLPWIDWHERMLSRSSWPEIPETCFGIHWFGARNRAWMWRVDGPWNMGVGAVPWAIRQALARPALMGERCALA
jgi:hypothetical protein